MPKRRNNAPVSIDDVARLSQYYQETVMPFLEHLSSYRPLVELDPADRRPLRLDKETEQYVPIVSWEQLLEQSGIPMRQPQAQEALRVCWVQLSSIKACLGREVRPRSNRLAIYMLRDGSWVVWLAHNPDGHEHAVRVGSLDQIELPTGYEPRGSMSNEQLPEYVARTIRNILHHALSVTITRHDGAVASMRHVQYAQGI